MVRVLSPEELSRGLPGFGVGFISGFVINAAMEAYEINKYVGKTPVLAFDDWLHMVTSLGLIIFGKPELGVGYLFGSLTSSGFFR